MYLCLSSNATNFMSLLVQPDKTQDDITKTTEITKGCSSTQICA